MRDPEADPWPWARLAKITPSSAIERQEVQDIAMRTGAGKRVDVLGQLTNELDLGEDSSWTRTMLASLAFDANPIVIVAP